MTAAAARTAAAAWMARQVDPAAIVACDPQMCAVLQSKGIPAGRLLLLGAGNAGPLVTLVQTFGIGVVATIASLVSSTASLGVILLLAVLLMYYFIRDGASFWRTFLDRVEPGRRSYVEAAGGRAFNMLGGYMLGTGAISIFGAATQFLIMTILGIPLALPLAVPAGCPGWS